MNDNDPETRWNELTSTIDLMKAAHKDQLDKGGMPYWQHPMSVMLLLGPEASLEEKVVALLHDVPEDTGITLSMLSNMGYSDRVIHALYLLTRPEGMPYFDYIERLALSENETAIRVKIADLTHNLDPSRLKGVNPSLAARYEVALEMIKRPHLIPSLRASRYEAEDS